MLDRASTKKINNVFSNIGTDYKELIDHSNKLINNSVKGEEVCTVSCKEVKDIIDDLKEGLTFISEMTDKNSVN